MTYFSAAGAAGAAANLNVPFSVVLFEILPTWSPYVPARIFNIAAVVAYLGAIALLLAWFPGARQPWRLIWGLGISSFWGTLALGQIYTFLALASALRGSCCGRTALLLLELSSASWRPSNQIFCAGRSCW